MPFTIVVDTREQRPWRFSTSRETVTGTLTTGDYSIKGWEDLVAIERKSLADLVQSCGRGRERFEKEIKRMRGFHCKAVIVEATRAQVEDGGWRSKISPASVRGTLASWEVRYGVPFHYAGDKHRAALLCDDLLRKYYDNCMRFAKVLEQPGKEGK